MRVLLICCAVFLLAIVSTEGKNGESDRSYGVGLDRSSDPLYCKDSLLNAVVTIPATPQSFQFLVTTEYEEGEIKEGGWGVSDGLAALLRGNQLRFLFKVVWEFVCIHTNFKTSQRGRQ